MTDNHTFPVMADVEKLRDYFEWMFGEGSVMQLALMRPNDGNFKDYKDIFDPGCVEGNPSLLTFLRGERWPARRCRDGAQMMVRPSITHLASQQFAQFLDARIRFGFASEPSLATFFAAWEHPLGLEELFHAHCGYCYIEGRAPGANFPDREILDTAGEVVAASVVIAPSALQAGLLRDLPTTQRRLARWP